jgi:ribosomal protein S12 methylthiotransferase accessory factor YcaO
MHFQRVKVQSAHIRKMQNMSRISAAKRLLDAFGDRSKAYDVPHEIGLTVFCGSVTTPVPLTTFVS